MEKTTKWYGNNNKGWAERPLWTVLTPRKNKNSEGLERNLLSLSYGKIIKKDIDICTGLLPESFNSYNIVEPGDLVMRLTDLQNDQRSLRTGLVKERGIITSAYLTLIPNINNDPRYLHYLLHSFDIIKGLYNMGEGIRQNLNYDELSRLRLIIPSLPEQSRIASFLDDRCAKIDEAIKHCKDMNGKLDEYRKAVITKAVTKGVRGEREMKASGFERIGLIPSNWNYRPLKSLGKFYGGMSGKAGDDFKVEENDAFAYYIPYTNIFNNFTVKPNFLAKVKIKSEEKQNYVNVGDILFLMSSEDYAGLGQSSVLLDDFDNDSYVPGVWLNSFCKGLHITAKDINSKFINYYLTSDLIHDYIRVKGEGYTRINLKTSGLGVCPVFVPPFSEQSEIVSFLDKRCAEIDSAKEKNEAIVKKLEEYKKSLIYHAVTGKIEC